MSTLRPEGEADLGDCIAEAAAAGTGLSVVGGGTRIAAPDTGTSILSTDALTGVTLYEPGALTLVVRAGTPLAEVEATLAGEGQMLPFEPWDARALTGREGTPTIGGAVAVNASGPRRIKAGACRDSLIGVRFVDGSGVVIKNGGRVMKNVTGLDLVKLLAGSHGTLGVLTEVSFKVLPRPETTATLLLDGLDVAQAVAAMTRAMATPYEVSAAAHVPSGLGPDPVTLLRVEGFAGSVAHRSAALAKALKELGTARIEEGTGPWAAVRDAALFGARNGAVWRISVKPTDGVRVAEALPEAETLFDWAGGLVWALVPESRDVRAALAGIPGHATLVRASEAAERRWGRFHPEPPPVAALSAGLRARFDPAGILNPGLMGQAAPVAA